MKPHIKRHALFKGQSVVFWAAFSSRMAQRPFALSTSFRRVVASCVRRHFYRASVRPFVRIK